MVTAPRFTLADLDRANAEWGCNCGPGALAAVAGLTLDEVRLHMGDFEARRYTNPTLMYAALRSIGVRWESLSLRMLGCRQWPRWGLARVQWEGPWTVSGVPVRARYRYTHWIGAATRSGDVGVFDVNALNNGSGWCALEDWESELVPFITQDIRRASGGWHITHAIEVEA